MDVHLTKFHNATGNMTESHNTVTPFRIVEVSIMLLIFLFSLMGNSMALFSIYKRSQMQTFIHWLIFNLAVADLTSSIVCLPLEIPILLNGGIWIYGSFLCPIVIPTQTISVFSSVFTLVALSISRHWAIVNPLRRQPTVKEAKALILMIWVASLICASPLIATLRFDENTSSCVETWSPLKGKVYTWILFIFQVLIPLVAMTIMYAKIFFDLKHSEQRIRNSRDQACEQENRRIVILLIVLTVTFTVCVFPCHLVFLVLTLHPTFKHDQLLISISYLLLYAQNAINPILYNTLNSKLRQSVKDTWQEIKEKVICCCTVSSRERISSLSLSRASFTTNGSLTSSRGNIYEVNNQTFPMPTIATIRSPKTINIVCRVHDTIDHSNSLKTCV